MLTKYKCPECGYHYSWYERAQFTKWFMRKTVVCPHCKTSLVMRKWSFVLDQITEIPFVIALIILVLNEHAYKSHFIVILLVLVVVINATQKIERYKE